MNKLVLAAIAAAFLFSESAVMNRRLRAWRLANGKGPNELPFWYAEWLSKRRRA